MIKRTVLTVSELLAFAGLLALVAGGCNYPAMPSAEGSAAVDQTQQADDSTDSKPNESETTNAEETMTPLAETPLIPREVLFGNPKRAQARLSPDGAWISFLAPVDGVLNVWVAPAVAPDEATAVTNDTDRGIRSHSWAYDSTHIVYTQDKGGNENWHLYATNVTTKETQDLTPIDGINARIAGASEKFPKELLVGINDRDPRLHDIYRVNVDTGKRVLVQKNPGVAGFVADEEMNVRLAVTFSPTGGQLWLKPEGTADAQGYEKWEPMEEIGAEDASTSGPVGFDLSGELLYFEDSRDRNTAGLFSRNLKTDDVTLVADNPKADVGGILQHPTDKTIQAVSFTYSRREWQILDERVRGDIEFLTDFADGEFQVTSRTLDDSMWTVAYIVDDGPLKFYLYERPPRFGGTPKMQYLLSSRDDLDDYPLVKMHAPIIESRDGLELVSYLSLPPGSDPNGDGVPAEPVPLVLDVHGGPWARDGWGFNSGHQWLANRGYAVLNVNYRGSSGFGKNFQNAGNGEWSRKMHDDLLDAVDWAVAQGICTKDQVCIMGGSYGGYATLVGLTYTPKTFACGVDIVGPSSLVTLMENAPPYWQPIMPLMKVRVGDWTTEEGRKELLARSPLSFVDKIERPLLIGQGANDPRVTQLEADQIVQAMTTKGIPVTYVLYPDEGHGFRRPPNNKSFNAITEAFLAEHLGGRYEPVGNDLEGSSVHVPTGTKGVPGLADVLPAERQAMPAPERPAPNEDTSAE